MKFSYFLILRKVVKIVATSWSYFKQKCTKIDFNHAGELTTVPKPASWILGVLLLREGRGSEGKEEGRVGREHTRVVHAASVSYVSYAVFGECSGCIVFQSLVAALVLSRFDSWFTRQAQSASSVGSKYCGMAHPYYI